MNQTNAFGRVPVDIPSLDEVPEDYRDRLTDLFDTWANVTERNRTLSRYYDMKSEMKSLGISIPPQCEKFTEVVGWCSKAVRAHAVRSVFDGFVFGGTSDDDLDALVRDNRLASLYQQACSSSLVHGVSALTVMRGGPGQPPVKVRAHSANQFCALWDKDEDRIGCGVVLADVDRDGKPSRYVAHMPDAVLTLTRVPWDVSVSSLGVTGVRWACEVEAHPMGRPLMEVIVHDPDLDRPLGHSLLTPELLGIVDKAMRDVLRMEIGAEFFTFPQRYALGVAEDVFAEPVDPDAPVDEDGDPVDEDGNKLPRVQSEERKFQAYIGAMLAFTRDENGDVPTVGQFSPTSAESFTAVFENDAQRFSGATNVPLSQLGVMSTGYTSSDALGAANNPLILEVEAMNRRNAEAMAEVGRMMMAVSRGVPIEGLPEDLRNVQAYFKDPSMPTIAARADAWTKLGASDPSIIGTRVYYEGVGLSQATIDRLMEEKMQAGAISALNRIADTFEGSASSSATSVFQLPKNEEAEGE